MSFEEHYFIVGLRLFSNAWKTILQGLTKLLYDFQYIKIQMRLYESQEKNPCVLIWQ